MVIEHKHGERLVVRDNAAGMTADELGRALRLSTPPADVSGRSEFGMGLKTAACWFGSLWTVSSTVRGERWRYTVVFDVDAIAKGGANHVTIERDVAREEEHGTTLVIERLQRPIAGRQVEKTKRLLASIYRLDLQRGDVRISWNGEHLGYERPDLIVWEVDDEITECRMGIDLNVTDPHTGLAHRVTGWAGALQRISKQDAGFALLRRGRMIIGGPGVNWRPKDVVGSLNSHSGKRLIGELQMDDFPVNFTKDGFAWDGGLEDALIVALDEAIAEFEALPTTRGRKKQVQPQDLLRAVDEVQRGLDHPTYREAVNGAQDHSNHEVHPSSVGDTHIVVRRDVPQELKVPLGNGYMRARLVLVDGGPQQSWLAVEPDEDDENAIVVNLNTGNRFVAQHIDNEVERTLVAKFALAVATAEAQASLIFGDEVPPTSFESFST